MLDTIRSKVEPAGLVHKFFGEQVPDGFFWVLLDAKYNKQGESIGFAGTPDSWFVEQWQGCILGGKSAVIKPSPRGVPAVDSSFIGYSEDSKNLYTLTLKCFETLEEAKEFVKKGDFSEKVMYNWSWSPNGTSSVDFVKKPKKTQGTTFDNVWFNESSKINLNSFGFKVRTSHFNEPTENQRIAQRQVDLNSAKITKLEKELKDLRELQKLLKGMR